MIIMGIEVFVKAKCDQCGIYLKDEFGNQTFESMNSLSDLNEKSKWEINMSFNDWTLEFGGAVCDKCIIENQKRIDSLFIEKELWNFLDQSEKFILHVKKEFVFVKKKKDKYFLKFKISEKHDNLDMENASYCLTGDELTSYIVEEYYMKHLKKIKLLDEKGRILGLKYFGSNL